MNCISPSLIRLIGVGTVLFSGFFLLGGCARKGNDNPAPLVQQTASGLQLGQGVNISHWLSQRSEGMPDPREFFTEEDVAFIAAAGFDHIRLPIEESIMWNEDGSQNAVSFETLENAMQWIREAGLSVVVDLHIINSHHFNAANDGGKNTLFEDPASQAHLVELWRQLSVFLHEWPNDFLAYEILNEAVAEEDEQWNDLLARCIPAIREWEPERPIVIGSNRFQSAARMPNLKFPPDDKNLILSFHFYHPFPFTHYKTSWVGVYSGYSGPISYPGLLVEEAELDAMPDSEIKRMLVGNNGPHDKESIRAYMRPAIEVAREAGLPLYCGEWGAYKSVDREDLLQWYQDVGEVLREEGIQHAIWDYKGGFSIRDHETGEGDEELMDHLLGR